MMPIIHASSVNKPESISESVRSKRDFFMLGSNGHGNQMPINFSILWLVKHYLKNTSFYLDIISKSYFVLIIKPSSNKL